MHFPPVAHGNMIRRAATAAPKHDAKATQGHNASVSHQDTVAISQAAKDMSAQTSAKTTSEEAGKQPAVVTKG